MPTPLATCESKASRLAAPPFLLTDSTLHLHTHHQTHPTGFKMSKSLKNFITIREAGFWLLTYTYTNSILAQHATVNHPPTNRRTNEPTSVPTAHRPSNPSTTHPRIDQRTAHPRNIPTLPNPNRPCRRTRRGRSASASSSPATTRPWSATVRQIYMYMCVDVIIWAGVMRGFSITCTRQMSWVVCHARLEIFAHVYIHLDARLFVHTPLCPLNTFYLYTAPHHSHPSTHSINPVRTMGTTPWPTPCPWRPTSPSSSSPPRPSSAGECVGRVGS